MIDIYHHKTPEFIGRLSESPSLRRLEGVGMNCGCEYTSLHRFERTAPYSRFSHSLGASLIVWHFTADVRQSVSALLHDIATPVFAHVIDFMHDDHVRQESTEDGTLEIIRSDRKLVSLLEEMGLAPEDVCDYHLFPIADNETPRLSSDRLEYTVGNMIGYGFADRNTAESLYRDITVGKNEYGEDELVFRSIEKASAFARLSLRCSKVYTSDEDRYAMQILAELIHDCVERGLFREDILYGREEDVISRLEMDPVAGERWRHFRALSKVHKGNGVNPRTVNAKKRHIDPYVAGVGRTDAYDPEYRVELEKYLSTDFAYPVSESL